MPDDPTAMERARARRRRAGPLLRLRRWWRGVGEVMAFLVAAARALVAFAAGRWGDPGGKSGRR